MNPIFKALDSGYSEEDILKYISKAIPQLLPKVTKAMSNGYGIKEILGYLAKVTTKEDRQGLSESQIHARNRDVDSKLAPHGLMAAATAIGAPIAAGAARSALSRALPQSLQGLLGGTPGSISQSSHNANYPSGSALEPTSQMPQAQTQLQPSQQPPNINAGNIQQETNIPQTKTNIIDFINKNKGFKDKIDQLKASGNDVDSIVGYFKKFNPSQTEKLEKETGRPIEEVVSEYIASKPVEEVAISPQSVEKTKENQHVPELQIPEQRNPEILPEITEPAEEAKEPEKPSKPIAKKDSVITPQGAGEIRDIKEKNALVEIDGKLHKVPIEDIEEEPEDVIQTVQQLLKIPEVDRSSVVSLFTYDPEESKMYIQFHTGDTYKYMDVDPEKVYKVANKMGIPITQGKNIFGAWSPEDKQSLGATLIKEIINDPKYKKAKKGEPENPNYVKLETLYDYWEKLRKKSKRKRL